MGTAVTIDGTNYTATDLPVSFLWTRGSVHTFSFASTISMNSTERYAWNTTTGLSTAQSTSLNTTSSGIVVGNYKIQYRATFGETGVGSDYNGPVVIIDGTHYALTALPVTLWWDKGSFHSYSFVSPFAVSSTEMYVWNSTSGWPYLKQYSWLHWFTGPFEAPVGIVGNYILQYAVRFAQSGVGTDFTGTVVTIDGISYEVSDLPVSFWYDSGSTHTFSFLSPLIVNSSTEYIWSTTTGLSTAQSSNSFQVTGPGSIIGNYYETTGVVGITGYKLVFKETMNNTLSVPVIIDYSWSFSVEKWNGTQWEATAISGSSPPASYAINALTTVDLPYYIYLLNSSGPNAVAWGEWLEISFIFHWTYSSGISYSTSYASELNVHPADVTGAGSVTFPYLGAVGSASGLDLHLLATYWLQSVPSGTDPTSDLARADIGDFGSVSGLDLHILAHFWLLSWADTPPTGTDPSAVTVNGSNSEAASQTQQYYLTITTDFGTVDPASGWLDLGSNATMQTAPSARCDILSALILFLPMHRRYVLFCKYHEALPNARARQYVPVRTDQLTLKNLEDFDP
jgi:hypothetical protein